MAGALKQFVTPMTDKQREKYREDRARWRKERRDKFDKLDPAGKLVFFYATGPDQEPIFQEPKPKDENEKANQKGVHRRTKKAGGDTIEQRDTGNEDRQVDGDQAGTTLQVEEGHGDVEEGGTA